MPITIMMRVSELQSNFADDIDQNKVSRLEAAIKKRLNNVHNMNVTSVDAEFILDTSSRNGSTAMFKLKIEAPPHITVQDIKDALR